MSGKSEKPYPSAPPSNAYPVQGSYPTAQYAQPQYQTSAPFQNQQQPYGQPGAGMYAGAPPPYSAQPQEAPPPYSQYPSQGQMYPHSQPSAMPPHHPHQHQAPPQGHHQPAGAYPQQQQSTVMVQGLFDAGARFNGISQAHIPPPPPGTMPNAAQMAAMQGHNVVGTQQRSNWFTGNSGGSDWGL